MSDVKIRYPFRLEISQGIRIRSHKPEVTILQGRGREILVFDEKQKATRCASSEDVFCSLFELTKLKLTEEFEYDIRFSIPARRSPQTGIGLKSEDDIPVKKKKDGEFTSSKCAAKVVRKYQDEYLKLGFTYCGPESNPTPQCVICGEKLSNESMIPSKMKRHLHSKYSHLSGKNEAYFQKILSSEMKEAKCMTRTTTVADRAQLASYKVAEIIAKKMQPHTLAETVILPACKEMVEVMLGEKAKYEITGSMQRSGQVFCAFFYYLPV